MPRNKADGLGHFFFLRQLSWRQNNPRQTLMVLGEASKDVALFVVWSLQTSMVQREQACGKGREKNLWERPEAGSLHVQNMEGRK